MCVFAQILKVIIITIFGNRTETTGTTLRTRTPPSGTFRGTSIGWWRSEVREVSAMKIRLRPLRLLSFRDLRTVAVAGLIGFTCPVIAPFTGDFRFPNIRDREKLINQSLRRSTLPKTHFQTMYRGGVLRHSGVLAVIHCSMNVPQRSPVVVDIF